MRSKLYELHLAQLLSHWRKSKNNCYSDNRKKLYHDNLSNLIKLLKEEEIEGFNDNQILERKRVVDFIFKSIEFLDSSVYSTIPYEIVFCLERALKDWIPNEKYIIVTSLVNNNSGFSFDSSLILSDESYQIINKLFPEVLFTHKLVQINLPKSLSRDYLANVALYHELGHFIDTKFKISDTLTDFALRSSFNPTILGKYIDLKALANPTKVKLYFGEYFCDVFASQYIDNKLDIYLSHITNYSNTGFEILSHPSTTLRNEIVRDFLSSKNEFLEYIKVVCMKITNKNLEKRFEKFNTNDIYDFLPLEVANEKQLHYLFIMGWDIWLGDVTKFVEVNDLKFPLKSDKLYQVINNLIEKSIGNFVVKKQWNNVIN